jgi:hypothetical protein
MRKSIAAMVSNPIARVGLLLSLLIAAVDFSQNILVLRSQADRDYRPQPVLDLKARTDESSATRLVGEWLGAVAAPKQGTDELRLEAIVSESGRLRAIIRQGANASSSVPRQMVGMGEQIADWQVVDLSRNSATLRRAEDERRLTLFRKDVGADE